MHAEIRGRHHHWRVWVPDQSQMATSVPLYDQEGNLLEMLRVGSPPSEEGTKYVECFGGPCASIEEATEYAEYLGYTEVKVVKTKTKQEALAKARAVRRSTTGA